MQTPIGMDKVTIEDYYRMTTMNKNMIWMKLTHLLRGFSLNLRGPLFVHLPVIQILNSLSKCSHKRKQYISLMYIRYVSAANNTLSYTHVSSYVV